MSPAVLVIGAGGKLGSALQRAFARDARVTGLGTRDLDACDFAAVDRVIDRYRPDILVNCAAFLGIDPCERDPERARRLNALYPGHLARRSREAGFKLIHISTDAVFPDLEGDGAYVESSPPGPCNLYGRTKLEGDERVREQGGDYLIARIGLLFGRTQRTTQFVEKMLARVAAGARSLRVAADIESSPCYSADVAAGIRGLVERNAPSGLYHLANQGRASLYTLMSALVEELGLAVEVLPASHHDFPALARKNLCTPLASEKHPPLRPWRQALQAYCRDLREAPGPGAPARETTHRR